MDLGIIGCGRIAQIQHIPHIVDLPDPNLTAIAEPAENVRQAIGERYDIDAVYRDAEDLVHDEASRLDGVIITTPMQTHRKLGVAALEAGLHTFIEKPLAVNVDDANELVTAAEKSDCVAMVGYNKRFEPAYDRAQQLAADLTDIDLITTYHVDADFSQSVPKIYDLIHPELPDSLLDQSQRTLRTQIETAVGTDDDRLVRAYDFQLEHICHDINYLQGLFGEIDRIPYVELLSDWKYLTASVEFEGDETCLIESGLSERHWFEEFTRIDAQKSMVTLRYQHPFVKYSPASLRVREGTTETVDETYTPTAVESFKRELQHFINCIKNATTVRTPFAQARNDIAVIQELFHSYQNQ